MKNEKNIQITVTWRTILFFWNKRLKKRKINGLSACRFCSKKRNARPRIEGARAREKKSEKIFEKPGRKRRCFLRVCRLKRKMCKGTASVCAPPLAAGRIKAKGRAAIPADICPFGQKQTPLPLTSKLDALCGCLSHPRAYAPHTRWGACGGAAQKAKGHAVACPFAFW